MSIYVDGYVLPVPKANVEAYRAIAQACSAVWKEYGAIDYVECIADDMQSGDVRSFSGSVQLQDDELVVFSWITYPSREVREVCNAKAMRDPRVVALAEKMKPIFDSQRMMWGGFKPIVRE